MSSRDMAEEDAMKPKVVRRERWKSGMGEMERWRTEVEAQARSLAAFGRLVGNRPGCGRRCMYFYFRPRCFLPFLPTFTSPHCRH
jgi:hypothetical protein